MTDGPVGFDRQTARRVLDATKRIEQRTATGPIAARKPRKNYGVSCRALTNQFIPSDYSPGLDVIFVVPAWTVEDVGGTPTVTGCTFQEVKQCPAEAPLQTTFDTEDELVTEHDPTTFPSGTLFYVTNDTDPNRLSDLYMVQGDAGGLGDAIARVGGLSPQEERQLAFWAVNQ